MKTNEYVLVFPFSLLKKLGLFQGLSREVDSYIPYILDKKNTKYIRRDLAEKDVNYKQLIPYVILRHENLFFSYRRGKKLSEKRLLGLFSIGIGGHISTNDPTLFDSVYEEGLAREINEEVKIESSYQLKTVALINDDSNEVGRVHFGVVHILNLENPYVVAREQSINEAKFRDIRDLLKKIDRFENWSQICLKNINQLI
jgi:predicted NUDIX family phosphoesterase